MKKLTVIVALIATTILFPSCSKNDIGVNATVGAQIGPVWVSLSIGSGQGPYYSYGNVPSNVDVTVCYIISRPTDKLNIAVFDQTGALMGAVSANNGNGYADQYFFEQLQKWNYAAGPCAVLVRWDNHFTSGPWSGHIIG